MTEKSWLEVVKDKEKEETDLHERQDADKDLRNLKAYKMKTLDGTKDAKDIANVTLPEPQLFLAKTIARLAASQRQSEVLADKKQMSDADTSLIESFVEDMEYEIDAYQNEQGEVASKDFHADIASSRGRVAEQIVTRVEDGVYIPDVRHLDTRYFSCDVRPKGMLWGAYTTTRTKGWLEEDYPDEISKIRGASGEQFTVRDIWTSKGKNRKAENIVYVNDVELRRKESSAVLGYPIDYPPFILQIVPAGSVLKDKGNLKYTGESVFEMLRSVFDEDNFIASTLKTLNYGLFKPPLSIAKKEGGAPPDEYVGDPGKMTIVDTPGAIQPIFMPDIKAFTARYDAKIRQIMDKAGYSSVDYGQATGDMSYIAMEKLAQGKKELLSPRLRALTLLYEARYRMIIRQFLAIGETLKLGEIGHRREYSPEQLKGEYKIKFHFFPNTNAELAANAALARALGNDVSEDYKRREIYKLPNPDGDAMQKESEQVDEMFPILKLFKQCHSLVDKNRDIEIEYLKRKIKALYQQEMMPTPVAQEKGKPVVPEAPEGKQLMPLFGGGGGGRLPTEGESE